MWVLAERREGTGTVLRTVGCGQGAGAGQKRTGQARVEMRKTVDPI